MSDDKQDLKGRLTAQQYQVTQQKGTEAPFTGAYLDNKAEGDYRCIVCNTVLFPSSTKYDSGSGWPSFYEASDPDSIRIEMDNSHGMRREESRGGPPPTCRCESGNIATCVARSSSHSSLSRYCSSARPSGWHCAHARLKSSSWCSSLQCTRRSLS